MQEENGWGAEFDFGYSADAEAGPQLLDVATYMFNGNWVQPRGSLRPFASIGAGLMQVDGCNAPCTRPAMTYDLGVNFGGGALYAVNDIARRARRRALLQDACRSSRSESPEQVRLLARLGRRDVDVGHRCPEG